MEPWGLEEHSHVPRAAQAHQERCQAGGNLFKVLTTPWP